MIIIFVIRYYRITIKSEIRYLQDIKDFCTPEIREVS
jgi:hypothetical protein